MAVQDLVANLTQVSELHLDHLASTRRSKRPSPDSCLELRVQRRQLFVGMSNFLVCSDGDQVLALKLAKVNWVNAFFPPHLPRHYTMMVRRVTKKWPLYWRGVGIEADRHTGKGAAHVVLQIDCGRDQSQVVPSDLADQSSLPLGVVEKSAARHSDLKCCFTLASIKVPTCPLDEAEVPRQLRSTEIL